MQPDDYVGHEKRQRACANRSYHVVRHAAAGDHVQRHAAAGDHVVRIYTHASHVWIKMRQIVEIKHLIRSN